MCLTDQYIGLTRVRQCTAIMTRSSNRTYQATEITTTLAIILIQKFRRSGGNIGMMAGKFFLFAKTAVPVLTFTSASYSYAGARAYACAYAYAYAHAYARACACAYACA